MSESGTGGSGKQVLTIDQLRKECSRCSARGSIEVSQSEDGGFSYQDQCPDCSSWGVVPATLADLIEVLEGLGAERTWICDYPEFNDDYCYVGHPNPEPDKTRQPRKHSGCGSYIVWRIEDE